jgi:hypothetical protein
MAMKIEDNLSSSKVEPFYAPRVKMDAKLKVVHNVGSASDIGETTIHCRWHGKNPRVNDEYYCQSIEIPTTISYTSL